VTPPGGPGPASPFPGGPWPGGPGPQAPGGPAPQWAHAPDPQPYGAQPPYGAPQPYGPPPYGGFAGGPPPAGPWPPYAQPPRKRSGLVVGLIAGGLVLVICVVVTAFLVIRDDRRGSRPVPLPGGVTATVAGDGTVTMVRPGVARPVVDVYEDFQCPVCKEFHRVNDVTLKQLAGEGRAKVVYRPIVIFQTEPLAGNSLRASAAAHCVTDGARWLSFQDQLFAHQPPEGSPGFGAADLVSYGAAAGIDDAAFVSCVRSQRYAADVRRASRTAIAGGVNGTPTVKVNGTAIDSNETLSAQGLRSAVEAAG
jgi:protein-disulfide isomerase